MYYFIVNMTGGSGRTQRLWMRIREILKERHVEYKAFQTKGDAHVRELSGRISQLDDDHIRLVVVGGDGTVNNVLNGIRDFERVLLAVIPTGSGNDFARGLNVEKDPGEVLEKILAVPESEEGACRRLDLGRVSWEGGSRLFGISAGAGLDALVCKQALSSRLKNILNKFGMGQLIYSLLTVKNLFTMRYIRGKAVFEGGDHSQTEELDRMIFLAAMNFAAEGGGVPMTPGALADDGMLSVCTVNGIAKLRTFFCFPRLLKAKHTNIKGFILRECKKLTLDMAQETVVHADGEYIGDLKQVTIECLPAVLRSLQ